MENKRLHRATNSLSDLPKDLLILITGYLSQNELFQPFSLVCHAFHSIVYSPALWSMAYAYSPDQIFDSTRAEAYRELGLGATPRGPVMKKKSAPVTAKPGSFNFKVISPAKPRVGEILSAVEVLPKIRPPRLLIDMAGGQWSSVRKILENPSPSPSCSFDFVRFLSIASLKAPADFLASVLNSCPELVSISLTSWELGTEKFLSAEYSDRIQRSLWANSCREVQLRPGAGSKICDIRVTVMSDGDHSQFAHLYSILSEVVVEIRQGRIREFRVETGDWDAVLPLGIVEALDPDWVVVFSLNQTPHREGWRRDVEAIKALDESPFPTEFQVPKYRTCISRLSRLRSLTLVIGGSEYESDLAIRGLLSLGGLDGQTQPAPGQSRWNHMKALERVTVGGDIAFVENVLRSLPTWVQQLSIVQSYRNLARQTLRVHGCPCLPELVSLNVSTRYDADHLKAESLSLGLAQCQKLTGLSYHCQSRDSKEEISGPTWVELVDGLSRSPIESLYFFRVKLPQDWFLVLCRSSQDLRQLAEIRISNSYFAKSDMLCYQEFPTDLRMESLRVLEMFYVHGGATELSQFVACACPQLEEYSYTVMTKKFDFNRLLFSDIVNWKLKSIAIRDFYGHHWSDSLRLAAANPLRGCPSDLETFDCRSLQTTPSLLLGLAFFSPNLVTLRIGGIEAMKGRESFKKFEGQIAMFRSDSEITVEWLLLEARLLLYNCEFLPEGHLERLMCDLQRCLNLFASRTNDLDSAAAAWDGTLVSACAARRVFEEAFSVVENRSKSMMRTKRGGYRFY